jgi:acetate kinase
MILVLNCGSQSIKWKVFNFSGSLKALKLVQKGQAEVSNAEDYEKTLRHELVKININDIDLIGHRVVHGSRTFVKPVKITHENLYDLEKLHDLAPLHNPYNVLGIRICRKVFAGVENIAVFDTEFFADLPEYAYTYALPEKIAEKFGFRRYGFQGTSHEYVAKKAAKDKFEKLKIITCHLGGGASICAIKNGKAVDTSMGFTPLEGLVMMTRSGNIDAGIVLKLAEEFGVEEANEILNKESGVKGICGEGDMLKLLEKIKSGDKKASLALDVFVYSIQKYIGSYFAILGGCDILVFTGSIGSGSVKIRNMICKDLNILKKPARHNASALGGTKIMAIETDEELAIAQKINSII